MASIVLLLLILVIGLTIALQSPRVQTVVVKKAAAYLSKRTGAEVAIEGLAIRPFRKLRLNNLYISDLNKDTLFAIGHLDARLSKFDPFNTVFYFDKIELYDVTAKVNRPAGSDTFNFYFLNKLLTSKQPKTQKNNKKEPIELRINTIDTRNIQFTWDDKKLTQYYNGRFDRMLLDIEDIDLQRKILSVNHIRLEKPVFNLSIYNQEKKKKEKKNFITMNLGYQVILKKLDLTDGTFSIKTKAASKPTHLPFHPDDFVVNDIDVQIRDGRWDSIASADLKKISARIGNKILLHEFSGKAYADSAETYIKNLRVLYNSSVIAADAKLKYSALTDYRDFKNAVFWEGKFKQIEIKKEDIALWLPENAHKYLTSVKVTGAFSGTFGNLRVKDLEINLGKRTIIAGRASVKGLPVINETLLDVEIDKFNSSIAEIKQLVPYVKLPPQLDKLGAVSFSGAFFGFVNDFVAYGKLRTDAGNISSDLKINIDKKTKIPQYSGSFAGSDVQINKFISKDSLFGRADFNLQLDGKGFNIKDLYTHISGTIGNAQINGYTYKDIALEGTVDSKLFTGTVNYNDECLYLDFDGTLDFNGLSPVYKARTSIRNADLMGLGLIDQKMIVSMDGYIDLQGKNLNDLNGQLDISQINLQNNNATIALSDTRLTILADSNGLKDYNIESDEISAWMKGHFDPLKIGPQVMKFMGNYSAYVPKNEKIKFIPQDFKAHFEMAADFGIVTFFLPKFRSFNNLYMNATFNNSAPDITLDLSADSLSYDQYDLYSFTLDGGKSEDQLIGFIEADSVRLGKKKKQTIPEVLGGVSTSLDTLIVDIGIAPLTASNAIRMQTLIDKQGDSSTFRVLSSMIRVNDKEWTVTPNNSILLRDSLLVANNFSLVQGDQSIKILNGKTSFEDARLEINNFNLEDIGQLLPNDSILRKGRLSGNVTILHPMKNMEADADLVIKGLNIFGYVADEFLLNAHYTDSSKIVLGKGSIDGSEYKLKFNGSYDINGKSDNATNIDADIEKASLGFLQLLLKKDISDTRAYIKGKVNVSGSLLKPRLEGVATVIDTARTTVNFLGAKFRFANEEIIIHPDEFNFGSITLFDPYGNKATASGSLRHDNFKKFALDLELSTDKFQLMNTTQKQNKDYYGTAFARADVSMKGPIENLNIDIEAKTLPNTIFSIPLSNLTNTETYNFIQFKSRTDTTATAVKEYKANLKGVNLNFDLEVTRDALLQIIFNPATNDMIKARGHGDLELDISSTGDFNIFGALEIDEGQYLFTFQNIINKRFEVKKGGTITWTGDPTNALLNVDAVYKTKIKFDNTLTDTSQRVTSRSIPIDLEMKLTGPLTETEIKFDIIPSGLDINTQSDVLNALLYQLRDDENLMNTQVFGILLFNRLLPTSNSGVTTGNLGAEFAGNTVTELLSTQFSMYLNDALSQFVKNVELDVNFRSGTFNNEGDNNGLASELDLGFKTKLFNDRVIVNVGGTFNFNQNDPTTQQSNTGIAGDFIVEYLVSADGRIRLKAFHKTSEYDIFGEQKSKTGLSLYYQKDFNKFLELLKRDKNKN